MVTILDGGMGQELVARSTGTLTPLWGAQVMLDAPHLVREIHDDFFASGAEIATTNTYTLRRDRLDARGLGARFFELHALACRMACEARDAHGSGLVAGSAGPITQSYVGDAGPPRPEAAALFDELARAQAPYVDILLAETVPSIARGEATLDGLEGHGKPVWMAVSVADNDGTKLRSGEPVEAAYELAVRRGVEALLVNCSWPEAVTQALELLPSEHLPLGAYANGFTDIPEGFKRTNATVDILRARSDLTPDVYADFAQHWVRLGATIVGGCCEVGPAHIAILSQRLKHNTTMVDTAATRA
ncbi:MAG: homocysteine S-methyltransferase family protein [Pseudomonadota bacterium]